MSRTKKLKKIKWAKALFAALFVSALLHVSVFAQQRKISLTSGGYPVVSGTKSGTAPSNQSPEGTTLTVNLDFGDVSPLNTSHRVVCVVPVRISADGNYKVEMQRDNFSAAGGGPQPKDIGFGVGNFRAQVPGSSQIKPDALSVSVANGFANDPTHFNLVQGLPQFMTTLENISTSIETTVLTGVATTDTENVNSDSGSIIANLTFVVVPQYFDPSDGASMLLTISIVPVD